MITQLRFKNWRSLKDVTIDDLQPINVFIGANSSGKTNILDGLHFLRRSQDVGIVQTVADWKGREKIRRINAPKKEMVDIELSYLPANGKQITQKISLKFQPSRDFPFFYGDQIFEQSELIVDNPLQEMPPPEKISVGGAGWGVEWGQKAKREMEVSKSIHEFIQYRWQMLDENFMPPTSLASNVTGDIHLLDRCADNLFFVLDFMQQAHPSLYENLQEDLSWLLSHVGRAEVERTKHESRIFITEKEFKEQEAPTISAGTSRILAMLTAFYALDMRLPEMPGLVVIEEPDMALNPGLLKRFVEQIRVYAAHEFPRQFIFTTHNPSFLNFFKPEEVRVVERDEQGYTSVKPIPSYIEEIWLKDGEYGLGEVWTTRSFGGLPE